MSLLDWLLPQSDVLLANELAEKIARHFPPTSEAKLAKLGGRRRLESVLQTVMDDLDTQQLPTKIGWFRKARLGNIFRWRLVDLGYSNGFVEALTEGLITHLATHK